VPKNLGGNSFARALDCRFKIEKRLWVELPTLSFEESDSIHRVGSGSPGCKTKNLSFFGIEIKERLPVPSII
jgi:hypothetical protein